MARRRAVRWSGRAHLTHLTPLLPEQSRYMRKRVRTSGIVTALGGRKDTFSYSAGTQVFYVQSEQAGIEVFDPFHNELGRVALGDKVELDGLVRERPKGNLQLLVCDSTKVISRRNALPKPVVVPNATMISPGTCSEYAERLESVVVQLNDLETLPCPPAEHEGYVKCLPALRNGDESSWDEYSRVWMRPFEGSAKSRVEVDNHMYSMHREFETVPRTRFASIAGVLSYYADPCAGVNETYCDFRKRRGLEPPAWELLPRMASDVTGPALDVSSLTRAKIHELRQLSIAYGNDATRVPSNLLGRDLEGTGHWQHGSCPSSWNMSYYYSREFPELNPNGSLFPPTNRMMCPCYPANGIKPFGTGVNSSSLIVLENVQITTLFHLDLYPQDHLRFYIEDPGRCGESRNGMMVDSTLSKEPAALSVTGLSYGNLLPWGKAFPLLLVGDRVRLIAEARMSFGRDVLVPFSITLLSRNHTICEPIKVSASVLDARRNREKSFCRSDVKQYEGMFVTIEPFPKSRFTVIAFTNDTVTVDESGTRKAPLREWDGQINVTVDGRSAMVPAAVPDPYSGDYLSFGPYGNRKCIGNKTASYEAGEDLMGCQFVLVDAVGNEILIDNLLNGIPAYLRYRGVQNRDVDNRFYGPLKVGDTFTKVTCLIVMSLGDYPAGYGGHFECNPRSDDATVSVDPKTEQPLNYYDLDGWNAHLRDPLFVGELLTWSKMLPLWAGLCACALIAWAILGISLHMQAKGGNKED